MRIAIYIDASNMYHCVREMYGKKLDYGKYKEFVSDLGEVVISKVYGSHNNKDADRFIHALHELGYETDFKQLRHFSAKNGGVTHKADQDINMAIGIIEALDTYDTVVLGTADGDFAPLVNYLRKHGKAVWVLALGISYELRDSADTCIEISSSLLV